MYVPLMFARSIKYIECACLIITTHLNAILNTIPPAWLRMRKPSLLRSNNSVFKRSALRREAI